MREATAVAPSRRRLSVEDRRRELLQASLALIGERPWDEVSMADVARTAGASKPLLYHYFPTKRDLYVAAVGAAAEELREATTPPARLGPTPAFERALTAHLDWIDVNADAYRAILQGAVSSHTEIQAIVERSRADVVARLARRFRFEPVTPAQRLALRAWVGFLEGACLGWLETRDVPKPHLVRILVASLKGVPRAAGA